MAKRCYYEVSLSRTHRQRQRHKDCLPQAGDGSSIRIAIPAIPTPRTASRKSTRPTRFSKTATSARPMTGSASRIRAGQRKARPMASAPTSPRRSPIFSTTYSAWAGGGAAAAPAASAAPTCATTWKSGCSKTLPARPRKSASRPRSSARPVRLRRQGRHQAEGLPDMRRPGQGPSCPRAPSPWNAPARTARAAVR